MIDAVNDAKEESFKKGEINMLIDILKDNLIFLSKECEEMIRNTDIEKLKELRKNILKIRNEEDIVRILKK